MKFCLFPCNFNLSDYSLCGSIQCTGNTFLRFLSIAFKREAWRDLTHYVRNLVLPAVGRKHGKKEGWSRVGMDIAANTYLNPPKLRTVVLDIPCPDNMTSPPAKTVPAVWMIPINTFVILEQRRTLHWTHLYGFLAQHGKQNRVTYFKIVYLRNILLCSTSVNKHWNSSLMMRWEQREAETVDFIAIL